MGSEAEKMFDKITKQIEQEISKAEQQANNQSNNKPNNSKSTNEKRDNAYSGSWQHATRGQDYSANYYDKSVDEMYELYGWLNEK